jgi:hypothetical protein
MATFALALWADQQRIDHQPSGALTVVHPEQSRLRFVASQQFPDFFAPEQFFQSHDIEESLHFCAEHFAYTQSEIPVAQISMDEALVLSVDGQHYHLTEKAHSDLCSILSIPIAFAYAIPTDLTALIVQRLKSLHAQSVIVVAREDTIVSLVDPLKWAKDEGQSRAKKKPHYLPVTNLLLLHMLEKVWSGQDADTRIILSDIGMQVELLQKAESFTVEPVVGDVTRVGVAITNSETGGPLPVAKGYTLRLGCSNGATVHTDAKLYRFSNDWRCSMEWRFDKFAAALRSLMQDMQIKCGALQTAYRRMAGAELDDVQFYNWYRKVQYLSRSMAKSSDHIDRIFGVIQDERQEFFKRVRERQRTMRSTTPAVIEPRQSTGLIAWEVFNGITQAARDEMHYHRRTGLESLAGDIVSAFMPSLN